MQINTVEMITWGLASIESTQVLVPVGTGIVHHHPMSIQLSPAPGTTRLEKLLNLNLESSADVKSQVHYPFLPIDNVESQVKSPLLRLIMLSHKSSLRFSD